MNGSDEPPAPPDLEALREQLIRELARGATEETDAASRQAALEYGRLGQSAPSAVRAEGRATVAAAGAAREGELAELRAALEQARAELLMARTAGAEAERERDQAARALAAEQAARAAEESGPAGERQQLEEMQALLESERAAAQTREREFTKTQQALQRELENEQLAHAGERTTGTQLLEAAAQLEQDLQTARGDADARSKTLSLTQVEIEKSMEESQRRLAETSDALTRAQQALKDAEARAEMAEQTLDELRRAGPPASASGAPAPPSFGTDGEGAEYRGPARTAKRVAMPDNVEVEIDGINGKLIDVSLTGAQILVPAALKPNRGTKVTFRHGDDTITCKGKIMWSRLESGIKTGQLWYRGGVMFTAPDETALDAFIRSQS